MSSRCLRESISVIPISTRICEIQCSRDHRLRKSLASKELRKGAEDKLRVGSGRVGSGFRRVGETHRSSRQPRLCVGGFHPPYNRQTRLREQTLRRLSTSSWKSSPACATCRPACASASCSPTLDSWSRIKPIRRSGTSRMSSSCGSWTGIVRNCRSVSETTLVRRGSPGHCDEDIRQAQLLDPGAFWAGFPGSFESTGQAGVPRWNSWYNRPISRIPGFSRVFPWHRRCSPQWSPDPRRESENPPTFGSSSPGSLLESVSEGWGSRCCRVGETHRSSSPPRSSGGGFHPPYNG